MSTNSSIIARLALNRLVVACRDEVIPLEQAALALGHGERRARLVQQARRRGIFRRDLCAGVVALGGQPTRTPSYVARLSGALRSVRRSLTGKHVGDAYAACARATEKTAQAYATALRLNLPDDARFGVELQYAEIELDRIELRRLRWGASLSPVPRDRKDTSTSSETADRIDQRALEAWGDDGGQLIDQAAELAMIAR
jgi:uncharacterized protein (TIGR02284 family)